MAIPINDSPPRNQYTATNGQTVFSYDFPIDANTDIIAYQTLAGQTANDVSQILQLTVQYTVQINPTTGMGTITLINGANTGDIITLLRYTGESRITNYGQNGPFTAESINDQLNSLLMMIQEKSMQTTVLSPHYNNCTVIATKDKLLPKLGAMQSWMMNSAGTGIIPVQLIPDDSTLRSELASQIENADGASLIGYYDSNTGLGKTVAQALIQSSIPIPDNQAAFVSSTNSTKKAQVSCANIPAGTTTVITLPAYNITLDGVQTGDVKLSYQPAAASGWVGMNDGSIGSATSGGTTRANADTVNLYTLLWNNVPDIWCPVAGGRGGSAAADFNANKPMLLPAVVGRALCTAGTASLNMTFTASSVNSQLTVPNINSLYNGTPLTVSSTGTLPGNLFAATTYYALIIDSTHIQLCPSAANAANFVSPITLTTNGTGTLTLTVNYTGYVPGSITGEQNHLMSLNDLIAHHHLSPNGSNFGVAEGQSAGGDGSTKANDSGSPNTQNTGNGLPFNMMQPSTFMNVYVKL